MADGNILKFENKKKITLGGALFAGILVYVVIVVFNYFHTEHLVRYEVVKGSLAANTIYTAVAIRNEKVYMTDDAGYVNYVAREGQRLAVGDLVYTVDETGKINDMLMEQSLQGNKLSDSELDDFKNDIVSFTHSYDNHSFGSVYDFKYSLKNTVLKIANNMLLDDLNAASASQGGLKYASSSETGVAGFWIDGYEELTPDTVNKSVFNNADYDRGQILGNSLHAANEPIYKLSTSEIWSVVIPVDQTTGEKLLEEDYVRVRFLKNQYESWGKVKLHHNDDGYYAELEFNNSMVTFANDRYLDIELVLREEEGLKIPNSAIVTKQFFLIDEQFVRDDGEGNYSVLISAWDDDHKPTIKDLKVEVYGYDPEKRVYYVDDSQISAGDVLNFNDGQRTFVVKESGELTGVYNINKGYADFKEVTILSSNHDYSIVKSNTRYGLRVYDYIALDASSVDDNQFIKSN